MEIFLAVVILLCLVLFFNLILVNASGNTFYPWAILLLFSPHEGVGRTFINYTVGVGSLVFIFIFGLILSIREYKGY